MVMADQIKSVAVIGAGVMGHAIAQEFAIAGYEVRLMARSKESLKRAMDRILENVERLRTMGKLDGAEVRRATQNIRTSISLVETVEDVDIVMEYVFEDIDLKRSLFGELDRLLPCAHHLGQWDVESDAQRSGHRDFQTR